MWMSTASMSVLSEVYPGTPRSDFLPVKQHFNEMVTESTTAATKRHSQ